MNYKEKLEEAKKLYASANADQKYVLESLFPELAESEDERIRKALIEHFRWNAKQILNEFSNKKALAWLEKQGEKIPVVEFKAKDWYVSKVDGKIYNFKYMGKKPTNQARRLEIEKAAMSATGVIQQEEWFIKGAEWSDKNPSYISSEKQDDNKSVKNIVETWKDMRLEVYQQASGNRHELNYSDDTTKMFSLNDIDDIIEKISEQKAADKVEPIFEVGDTMRTLQEASNGITSGLPVVVSIDNEYYRCNNETIAIKDQNNYEYPPINKKPTAWSEEDEKMFNNMDITLFEETSIPNVKYWKFMNWLKSLKQRMNNN